jgi:hypothetical protein
MRMIHKGCPILGRGIADAAWEGEETAEADPVLQTPDTNAADVVPVIH